MRKGAIALGVLLLLAGCGGGSPTPGGSCESTRDCVAGELCVSSVCTPSSNPSTDSGVLIKDAGPSDSGTTTSTATTCTRDEQCGSQPTNVCASNQCVQGCNESGGLICTGGTQCAASGHCIDVNAPCTLDAECMPGPPARVCIDQTCVAGCDVNPSLCTAGTEVCDTTTGRCVPAPMPCADDTGCAPPATVCESTQCVPGCGQPGGLQCSGSTPNCDPLTGRCLPPPGCQLDSQCTGMNEICVNMACIPRCDQPGGLACGTDVCNPDDGRCLPGQLPLGDPTCLLDAQCATGICLALTIGGGSVQICTDPCSATSQCPLDYSCVPVSGMTFCLSETLFNPQATFDTPSGGTCSDTVNTCQSFWCNLGTSQCIETCSRDSDCASYGGNCWMYTQDVMGVASYDHLCFPQPTLNLNGVVCTSNANCRSGICSRYDNLCVAHCCGDADCPAAQSCELYDVDATTIVKACGARNTNGTGALGSACTVPADCESEICAGGVCSTLCCRDADCAVLPTGGSCLPTNTPITGQIAGACFPN